MEIWRQTIEIQREGRRRAGKCGREEGWAGAAGNLLLPSVSFWPGTGDVPHCTFPSWAAGEAELSFGVLSSAPQSSAQLLAQPGMAAREAEVPCQGRLTNSTESWILSSIKALLAIGHLCPSAFFVWSLVPGWNNKEIQTPVKEV